MKNVFYVSNQSSDGFDYPVGNRDNFDGWYTYLSLGGSWCRKDEIMFYYGHLGEDYLKDLGSAKGEMVYSVSNGVVYKIYTSKPDRWGGVIIIKHVASKWNKFSVYGITISESAELFTNVVYTLYGHLDLAEIYVHENDNVARGTPIGKIGFVPVFPTPHLHFEVKSQKGIDSEFESGVGHGYSGTDNFAPNRYKPLAFIRANRPKIR
jgi:murein DD-endopeptidase MepM/ murein hydrolase activator NlpD